MCSREGYVLLPFYLLSIFNFQFSICARSIMLPLSVHSRSIIVLTSTRFRAPDVNRTECLRREEEELSQPHELQSNEKIVRKLRNRWSPIPTTKVLWRNCLLQIFSQLFYIFFHFFIKVLIIVYTGVLCLHIIMSVPSKFFSYKDVQFTDSQIHASLSVEKISIII